MARPFRFQPPSLPEPVLRRPRLADRLDARWGNRLVTVVAGPGFGKTMLLAGALGDDDRWLACEPGDESADHLVAGLAAAADLPSGATTRRPRRVGLVADAPAHLLCDRRRP